MPVSNLPIFPQTFADFGLANAAVTTASNVVVGGTNGTKLEALVATSNDTIDHLLTFSLNVAGTLYPLGQVNIPANSGNLLACTAINIFGNSQFAFLPQDPNGNKYLYLANASCGLVVVANSANSVAHAVVTLAGSGANF